MILGRKARRRMRLLEQIADGRFRVLVDGEVYSEVSAEGAYLIARYGAFARDGKATYVDTLRLCEATVVTIEYSHPVTP